jgi:hypothetical protein
MEEYRIGNIIQFSEINQARRIQKGPYDKTIRFGKVNEIYSDTLGVIDEKGKRYKLKEAQPVELTYKILLRCKFRKTGGYYHRLIAGTKFLLVYPTVTTNNPVGLYLGKEPFSETEPVQVLFHRLTALHHLQNLYFAMTREELVWSKCKLTVKELEDLGSMKKPLFDL